MIRISVIIPTYNRRHVLERTLPGVLAQDFPPQDYEVIVVMDGSTDGTAELLRELEATVLLARFGIAAPWRRRRAECGYSSRGGRARIIP